MPILYSCWESCGNRCNTGCTQQTQHWPQLAASVQNLLPAMLQVVTVSGGHSCRVYEPLCILAYVCPLFCSAGDQQQHQQQLSPAAQQLAAFCQEQYQLLSSVQVLASSLTSSAAGWAYLAAATHGLAALAQAINVNSQVGCIADVHTVSIPTCVQGVNGCSAWK